MKSDEDRLLDWLKEHPAARPRDAKFTHLDIPAKRIDYMCKKWLKNGFYNYGVSIDLGWFDWTKDPRLTQEAE